MNQNISGRQFKSAIDALGEAFRNALEHPSMKTLATVILQCDVVKAAATAFAGELEMAKKEMS